MRAAVANNGMVFTDIVGIRVNLFASYMSDYAWEYKKGFKEHSTHPISPNRFQFCQILVSLFYTQNDGSDAM